MGKRRALILLIIILLFCSAFYLKAAEESKEILVTLTERAGLDWKNTPVTIGIPVPHGEKSQANSLRILDQWGREVPSQAIPIGIQSEDAPIKWWRVTFLGTINKNDSLTYRVVSGGGKPLYPRTPLELKEVEDGYLLENGNLRLEINKNKSLLSKVWFDPNGRKSFDQEPINEMPILLGVKTGEGSYDSSFLPPTEILLEEVGPVRIVINIKGLLANESKDCSFNYDCRLISYAESSVIRMEIGLINSTGKPISLEEAWVKWQISKDEKYQAAFGSGGQTPLSVELNKSDYAGLFIDEVGRLRCSGKLGSYSPKGETIPAALGWVDLTGRQGGVSLGLKAFSQQAPKGLQLTGDGEIRIDLIPSSTNTKLIWENGVAKTDRLTIDFHSRKDRNSLKTIGALTNYQPIGVVSPDWLNRVGVLSQPLITKKVVSTMDAESMQLALILKEKQWSELLNLFGPPDYGAAINPKHWGFFNYGDLRLDFSPPWAVAGEYWNNNSYDLPYQLLRALIQTGDPSFWEIAEAAVTHLRDIDLMNPSGNTRPFPGLNHIKDSRTGNPSEAEDFRNISNRGLLLAYYLLDDQHSLELAIRIADRVCLQSGINLEEPQTLGLSIIAVLTGYQATGRKIYLERAEELVQIILKWQAQHEGGIPSDFIYKSGLVTESLVEYYKISKDPKVLSGIKSAVDYALFHFWDEELGFIQNHGGLLLSSALNILFTETGESRYFEVGMKQLKTFVEKETVQDPKEAALYYRTVYSLFESVNVSAKGK
jgi:hypothetical protein